MTADQNVALYRRWLEEIWNNANYSVADEVLAEDLLDHTPMAGRRAR